MYDNFVLFQKGEIPKRRAQFTVQVLVLRCSKTEESLPMFVLAGLTK